MNEERILSTMYRYGEEIKILQNGRSVAATKAFIQPLRYKNRMYVSGRQIPDGYRNGLHFLLICPKKADLSLSGTVIERLYDGGKYAVKHADDITLRGSALYIWAIITPCGKQKEDAYAGKSA